MRQNTPGNPRFDEYLSKIEQIERNRRRKRMLMLVPVLLVAGGGLWIFSNQSPQEDGSNPVQFASQTQDVVKADNSEWLNLEPTLEQVANPTPVEEAPEPVVIEKEKVWFSVDVSGRRQVREVLVYRIENYQPEYTYTIDFGNGVVKPMEESITYRYPLPGHFDMILTAVAPNGDTIEYLKKYEILPAEQSVTAQVSQP